MKYKLSYNIIEDLNKQNIELCNAKIEELDNVIELYKERIEWFRENGIDQWQDYFIRHPIDEFINIINNQRMFYLKKDEKIIAVFELATELKYWDKDDNKAFYICKLVTKTGYKNICNIIFDICKNIAIDNDVRHLRLICIESNYKLNSIYESHGFEFVNIYSDEKHKYNLRQLNLNF